MDELLSPFILKTAGSILTAILIALFWFFWRLPKVMESHKKVLMDLTIAIAKFEKSFELATKRMDELQARQDVVDQLFSDIAERGVNTRLISEGRQVPPKFPFKRRRDSGDEK